MNIERYVIQTEAGYFKGYKQSDHWPRFEPKFTSDPFDCVGYPTAELAKEARLELKMPAQVLKAEIRLTPVK